MVRVNTKTEAMAEGWMNVIQKTRQDIVNKAHLGKVGQLAQYDKPKSETYLI